MLSETLHSGTEKRVGTH